MSSRYKLYTNTLSNSYSPWAVPWLYNFEVGRTFSYKDLSKIYSGLSPPNEISIFAWIYAVFSHCEKPFLCSRKQNLYTVGQHLFSVGTMTLSDRCSRILNVVILLYIPQPYLYRISTSLENKTSITYFFHIRKTFRVYYNWSNSYLFYFFIRIAQILDEYWILKVIYEILWVNISCT